MGSALEQFDFDRRDASPASACGVERPSTVSQNMRQLSTQNTAIGFVSRSAVRSLESSALQHLWRHWTKWSQERTCSASLTREWHTTTFYRALHYPSSGAPWRRK
jgi:hypothetical protein